MPTIAEMRKKLAEKRTEISALRDALDKIVQATQSSIPDAQAASRASEIAIAALGKRR